MTSFAEAFCEHLPKIGVPTADLEAALTEARGRAMAAWPDLHVADAAFARQLARAVTSSDDVVVALRAVHAEDLYFVTACASRDEKALAQFERRHALELVATLRRMGLAPVVCEETLQVMREELFVSVGDAEPRILKYSGRGHLRGWLRAVAARTGLRVGRATPRTSELHESSTGAADDDLELAYLKRTYGASFQTAFRVALGQMPPKDRLLLKQRFQHFLSIEEVAALHGVHASTVSRWVTDARERLVTATREEMMRNLQLGRAEVSSILRLIRGSLDITLSTLAPGDAPESGAA